MARDEMFGRRLLVSVDAQGYGSANGNQQIAMQRGLVRILDEAAEVSGLSRSIWERQPAGDGELAVLPPSESETVLVDDFVRELDRRLAGYNEDRLPTAHLRLRVAVHHGAAFPAANGYAGVGVVVVSRLVECQQAKRVQRAMPCANVVLVLANRVFLDVVAQRHTHLRPDEFRKIAVRVKEYADDAWLYVPVAGIHTLDIGSDGDEPERTDATSASSTMPSTPNMAGAPAARHYVANVISEFNAPVTAHVIGFEHRETNG
jgi:hypothetical protein